MSHDICSHIAPSRGSKAPTGSPVTDPGQIYPAVDEAIGADWRYPVPRYLHVQRWSYSIDSLVFRSHPAVTGAPSEPSAFCGQYSTLIWAYLKET
jgi:hypothetical protein